MKQEFFKSTLISKYIKYLLSYTPLPLYSVIEHDQFMVEGCTYIHKDKVLKCTKSGIFNANLEYRINSQNLCVSKTLTVKDDKKYPRFLSIIKRGSIKETYSPLVVTNNLVRIHNIVFAEYDIINHYNFGEYKNGITKAYVSNSSYYDSDTHKCLGDYLRLVRNQYDVDLMPLYNCYNYEVNNNISFNSKLNTKTPVLEKHI